MSIVVTPKSCVCCRELFLHEVGLDLTSWVTRTMCVGCLRDPSRPKTIATALEETRMNVALLVARGRALATPLWTAS